MRLISRISKLFWQPKFAVLTVIVATYASNAALADDMAEGKRFYAVQDYNKAALSFQKAVAKNGRDATAHYYLGHCYVAKRDYGEARAEYQSAADLTKDAKVREYCENLVAGLEARHAGLRGTSSRGSGGGSGGRDGHLDWQVNGQTTGMSASESQQILDKADRDCDRIREQKNAALAPYLGNDRMLDARNAISNRYDARMREIQEEANNRVHRGGR